MKRRVDIADLDPFVPFLSEDEQRDIVGAMAAGALSVEFDAERYDELWCKSLFRNADTILRTEDAMRRGVTAYGKPYGNIYGK